MCCYAACFKGSTAGPLPPPLAWSPSKICTRSDSDKKISLCPCRTIEIKSSQSAAAREVIGSETGKEQEDESRFYWSGQYGIGHGAQCDECGSHAGGVQPDP